MISHKYKLIFIHIPKCAGSSIKDYYFDEPVIDWKVPNYEILYGWCPKRQIHLQHATSKQLLETGLISKDHWSEYFKFTFIRNPFDRAYSDYLWIQKDRKIRGSFQEYILQKGNFDKVLNDCSDKNYRGDHVISQTDFFDFEGHYKMDFVGRFESLNNDIEKLNKILGIQKPFTYHSKKNKNRLDHYSLFYSAKTKRMVAKKFSDDLNKLDYRFDDQKTLLDKLKKLLQ